LLDHNRCACHIDQSSFGDLALVVGLTKLSCCVVEGDDVVPDSLASILGIHGQGETCCRTVVSGAEPRVTTEPAAELQLLYFATLVSFGRRCTAVGRCSGL